jgi:peptide/nickel transport system substrate-binding protein
MNLWRWLSVAVVAALVVAAGAPAVPAQQAGGGLVVQATAEPPGLDMTASPASAIQSTIHYNVQEGLVKLDRHGKLVPWLAERWYTTDNLNYTFFLKKGVRFHNGRELTAADVKFVLERAMNPETKHPHRKRYEGISNIIVRDPHTVTVTLKAIDADFLLTLSRGGSVIYPREAADTLKTAPVGTGPFVFSEWVRGDRLVLVRNRDYHVKGLPHLDKVTFRFIPDPNAALAALRSGDIDVSPFGIGPENVPDLKKDPRFQVILGDTTNDVILSMNNGKKPFSDKRVRLAITHAIHKEEVLKGAMFGYGKILGSNVDPTNPYFVDLSKEKPYDAARARQLLAEAGYPNGFDAVLKIAPQYYYTVRTAEVLVNQLAKVGVRVKIEQVEWGQWLSQVYREANYDMSIIGHAEPWDINNYANPKYYYRWDSPDFQALFKESEVTLDDARRRELYGKMQRMLAEEAPAVWLYMYPRLVAAKKGVTGLWKDLPAAALDLSEVSWQK